MTQTITAIKGDGIGPEVINATIEILNAANAPLNYDYQDAGKKVFESGNSTGVTEETIISLQTNKVALKGPLATPIGHGEKSANVTLRKLFETYANIRPCTHLPNIKSNFSHLPINLTVIRENAEDLYAGIEHMQTADVAQSLKLISRQGCEAICRFAFEFAKANHKKTLHCATKANILKLTEGLLKETFETLAKDYPEIDAKHIIIDNCAHQLVIDPTQFEVIVTSNMNGDILSDLTSGLVGGLGVAPSANIGNTTAIFEAVHGSAPDIAGKNLANPTATILSAVLMLRHLGLTQHANTIESALLNTLEQGHLTGDLTRNNPLTTTEFTQKIITNLGKAPSTPTNSPPVTLNSFQDPIQTTTIGQNYKRSVAGIDIFLESEKTPEELGRHIEELTKENPLKLKLIANRGTKVYPGNTSIKDTINHWQCRFEKSTQAALSKGSLETLLQTLLPHYNWIHIEKLLEINGLPAYTKLQGE